MDDALVGTQAPGRRLVDAAEAVAELERVLPGLAALRLRTAPGVDWARLEDALGTALPADYKLFCDRYPAIDLSDFVRLGGPPPGAEAGWVRHAHEELEIVAEWCEDAEFDVPLEVYPAPGGLLPWACSNQGDYFLWTTSPAGPQEWTVTVASRNGDWWHYAGGAVQFVADLVSGALEPWALPTVRAEITWVHEPEDGRR